MTSVLTTEGKARLTEGIQSQERVSGLTHNFYRYPARFSPDFVRAIISEFTKAGDVVYDPFMGGGTTLVEASAMGRNALGTDISSLAKFISEVKTTTYSRKQLSDVEDWLEVVTPYLTVVTEVAESEEWVRTNYQKNINDKDTWRIRKLLEIGMSALELLDAHNERQLARCIFLKTGQWALDCRSEIPSPTAFQKQIGLYGREIIDSARDFSQTVRELPVKPEVKCLHRSAIGVESDSTILRFGRPKLILTSPPYPGLHVLYHRWQVKGRRETAAPFWIAGTLDGDGASFYTFGDRKTHAQSKYFDNVRDAFSSIASIVDRRTTVVQMVAFSQPDLQLPRYLQAMSDAGFHEVRMSISSEESDGRVWRSVPGRKWYASQMGITGGSQEVVLFHKKT